MLERDGAPFTEAADDYAYRLPCTGPTARRAPQPAPDWPGLVRSLRHLGPVAVHTGNSHAAMEQVAQCRGAWVEDDTAVVLAETLDLRLRLDRWAHAVSTGDTTIPGAAGLRIIDQAGVEVLRLRSTPETDASAWRRLLDTHARALAPVEGGHRGPSLRHQAPIRVDREVLRRRWEALRDPAALGNLFSRLGLSRLQGLRLGGSRLAWRVDHGLVRLLLETMADWILDVQITVPNPGVTQVHEGPIYQVQDAGDRVEIRDEDFCFRFREEAIAHAWVVRSHARQGPVTTLELFDVRERPVARLAATAYGGEAADWRRIINALPLIDAGREEDA